MASPRVWSDLVSMVLTMSDTVTATSSSVATKAARVLTVESITGTSYTLVLSDSEEKLKRTTNASPVSITVPPNSSVAFPVGSLVSIAQWGAGLVTIVAGSGVTIRTPPGLTLVSAGQYSPLSLAKVDTNEWLLSGALA